MDGIDEGGFITSGKVFKKTSHVLVRGKGSVTANFTISRGKLKHVISGIVVHQTNTASADKTFTGYTGANSNGAHFLIDLNGTVYQTASLFEQTNHVGAIRARCLRAMTCPKVELDAGLKDWNVRSWVNGGMMKSHNNEKGKSAVVERFPKNEDSIGIELVGLSLKYDKQLKNVLEDQAVDVADERVVYNPLTAEQLTSLEWLLRFLSEKLKVPFSEVFRHPEIAFKIPSEAITAKDLIEKLKKEEAETKVKKEETKTNNQPGAGQ